MIVDVVYGHTGVDFPYYDAYTRLRYRENPFMGPFAKDYFSNFGKSTDFRRPLTRDYFFTVNHHWLEVYHVDGFRYDCVPNYWDGPLASATRTSSTRRTSSRRADRAVALSGTASTPAGLADPLVQCAEQLEGPEKILRRRTRIAPGRTAPSTRRGPSRAGPRPARRPGAIARALRLPRTGERTGT